MVGMKGTKCANEEDAKMYVIGVHGAQLRNGVEPSEIRRRIFCLLEDEPYIEDVVVECYDTSVLDRFSEPRPYLHLGCDGQAKYKCAIASQLKKLGMRVMCD